MLEPWREPRNIALQCREQIAKLFLGSKSFRQIPQMSLKFIWAFFWLIASGFFLVAIFFYTGWMMNPCMHFNCVHDQSWVSKFCYVAFVLSRNPVFKSSLCSQVVLYIAKSNHTSPSITLLISSSRYLSLPQTLRLWTQSTQVPAAESGRNNRCSCERKGARRSLCYDNLLFW